MNSVDCLLGKMKRKRFMGPQGGALLVHLLHLEAEPVRAYSDSLSANCRLIASYPETGSEEINGGDGLRTAANPTQTFRIHSSPRHWRQKDEHDVILGIDLGEGSFDFQTTPNNQTTVLLEFPPGPDNIHAGIP